MSSSSSVSALNSEGVVVDEEALELGLEVAPFRLFFGVLADASVVVNGRKGCGSLSIAPIR